MVGTGVRTKLRIRIYLVFWNVRNLTPPPQNRLHSPVSMKLCNDSVGKISLRAKYIVVWLAQFALVAYRVRSAYRWIFYSNFLRNRPREQRGWLSRFIRQPTRSQSAKKVLFGGSKFCKMYVHSLGLHKAERTTTACCLIKQRNSTTVLN